MHTDYTPKLNEDWDLQIGADGNLKMLTGIEATSQNIANECRCFKGGLFYYQDHGIAWFSDQLGQRFQRALLVNRLRDAALNVIDADRLRNIEIESYDVQERTVKGRMEILTKEGENAVAHI